MLYSVYSQRSHTRYFSKSIFGNNRQIILNHHPVKRKKKGFGTKLSYSITELDRLAFVYTRNRQPFRQVS